MKNGVKKKRKEGLRKKKTQEGRKLGGTLGKCVVSGKVRFPCSAGGKKKKGLGTVFQGARETGRPSGGKTGDLPTDHGFRRKTWDSEFLKSWNETKSEKRR